jgi:hypothetical protein
MEFGWLNVVNGINLLELLHILVWVLSNNYQIISVHSDEIIPW